MLSYQNGKGKGLDYCESISKSKDQAMVVVAPVDFMVTALVDFMPVINRSKNNDLLEVQANHFKMDL